MVVAVTQFQLLVVQIDASADSGLAHEIEWRSFDAAEFSRGNRTGVDGRKVVGRDRQSMIENVAVVYGEFVFHTVQSKSALADPVAIAANESSEVRRRFQISCKIVEAKHNVVERALAIPHSQRNNDAAIVRDFCLKAVRIG